MSEPLRIALTGGIASGKSAAADMFAALGVPVLDTDQIARDVVKPGMPALQQVAAAFGSSVLDENGALDRKRMRALVFEDQAARKTLEAILHPAIREELARRSQAAGGLYQIHVIPLLVETGRSADYDRVLVVDCPEEQQLRRLMSRDGSDETQARNILAAQASREVRLAIADDVIVNTGTLEELQQFVQTLHGNYKLLAQRVSGS